MDPYTVFRARLITFFPVFRAEQKTQSPVRVAAVWLSFFVELGLTAMGVSDKGPFTYYVILMAGHF